MLRIAPLAVFAVTLPAATFVSKECRIRFDDPAGWVVTRDSGEQEPECSFTVRPKSWQRLVARLDRIDR
jgi:hypothetical protein